MTNAPQSSGATFYSPDGTIISSTEKATAPTPDARQDPAGEPNQQPAGRRQSMGHSIDPNSPIEDQADDLVDLIHERFMTLLRNRLEETDGTLNTSDVDRLSAEFLDRLDDVREIFINAVESHTHAQQPEREHNERHATFERLMVQRFETRFAPDHVVARDPSKLSRRMLPGYFNALSLLLGPQRLSHYREKSSGVRRALEEKLGDDFSWPKVYGSSHARKIALRAQIDIARHFENVDKRVAWLVALVNSNMIPTDHHRPAAGWSFSENAARQLLRDILSDLAAAMNNKATRDALQRELGEEPFAQIRGVLKRLN